MLLIEQTVCDVAEKVLKDLSCHGLASFGRLTASIDFECSTGKTSDCWTAKKIKDNEYRVGLTPAGVRALTDAGHREAGTQVLDIFSEWKSVYVDYSGKLQKAQIDEVEV